jgi:Flp pilus assembly protein TadG
MCQARLEGEHSTTYVQLQSLDGRITNTASPEVQYTYSQATSPASFYFGAYFAVDVEVIQFAWQVRVNLYYNFARGLPDRSSISKTSLSASQALPHPL